MVRRAGRAVVNFRLRRSDRGRSEALVVLSFFVLPFTAQAGPANGPTQLDPSYLDKCAFAMDEGKVQEKDLISKTLKAIDSVEAEAEKLGRMTSRPKDLTALEAAEDKLKARLWDVQNYAGAPQNDPKQVALAESYNLADTLCRRPTIDTIARGSVWPANDEGIAPNPYDSGQTILTHAVAAQVRVMQTATENRSTVAVDIIDIVLPAIKAAGGSVEAPNQYAFTPYEISRSFPQKNGPPGDPTHFTQCTLIKAGVLEASSKVDAAGCAKIIAKPPAATTNALSEALLVQAIVASPDDEGAIKLEAATGTEPVAPTAQAVLPASSVPPPDSTQKALQGLFGTLTAWSAASPVIPDIIDKESGVASYASTLLGADQGVALSSQFSGSKDRPKAQGEIRSTFVADRYNQRAGDLDLLGSGSYSAFVYGSGNLNPPGQKGPPSSDWASLGVGVNALRDISPDERRAESLVTRWLSFTGSVGTIDDRFQPNDLYYNYGSFRSSLFFPFWLPFDQQGHPIYVGVTAGTEALFSGDRNIVVTPATKHTKAAYLHLPGSFGVGRFDLYAYPCYVWNLCGWISDPSALTAHLYHQNVDSDGGSLNSVGLTWSFTKSISLTFSRSWGTPDPIANFGVFQTRSATSQLSLSVKGGTN